MKGSDFETPIDLGMEDNPPLKKKQERTKSIWEDEIGNLKIVNIIVRYPSWFFFFMIAVCIGTSFLLVRLIGDESPFTDDTSDFDIFDVRGVDYHSLKLAEEEVNKAYEKFLENEAGPEKKKRIQQDYADSTLWIYESLTDKGIFTREGIERVRQAERTITDQGNHTEYCQLIYESGAEGGGIPECRPYLSAMNIYYASEWNATIAEEVIAELSDQDNVAIYNEYGACVEFGLLCPDDEIPEENRTWVSSIDDKIVGMIRSWDGKGDLNPNVDEVTSFLAHIKQLRTKEQYVAYFFDKNFNVTNPISLYSRSVFYWGQLLNGTKDEEETLEKLKKYILDNLAQKWNDLSGPGKNNHVEVLFFMGQLIFDLILVILTADGLKAVGSFVAVFLYLRYMLGSWFLTAVGMFEIFMSLPLAWFSFSFIFQIEYFSVLNVLCLFIVMAIGADDIFVFMDAYNQSASKGDEVLSSLETRMSWVFRRSGSAMLITSATTCSAFLATLISPLASINAFGVFAAFVILYDYVLVMTLFCSSVVIYHNRFENKPFCCNCTFWVKSDPTPTESARLKGEDAEEDRISTFFKEKVGPFILSGRNRIILAVVFVAWIVTATIFTSRLKPTTTAEQFLAPDHPLQKGVTILSEEFPTTQEDTTSLIYYAWGLDPVNREGVNQLLNPDYIGEPVYTDGFDLNEQCQTEMLKACEKLRTDPEFEDFILRKNGLRSVNCFVEELGFYNTEVSSNVGSDPLRCLNFRSGNWTDLSWQVKPDELTSRMKELVTQQSCNDPSKTILDYYGKSMGWDGNSLRYAGIQFDSNLLNPFSVEPEDVARIHYDKFIGFAKELDKTMEDVCLSKTIMTDLDQKFVVMNNQRIYRTSAISGAILGVGIAFGVVLISTRKLHVAFFATSTILCILVSVIGTVTMMGWSLGSIEAILISILAGFSVDYVIHLAHAYMHASGSPDERIIEAYGDMGISVFSGMLTSVVASIPLFFCTLVFFAKFGTFLCLTIVISWIFANFFFMGLLAQFKISMDKKWL